MNAKDPLPGTPPRHSQSAVAPATSPSTADEAIRPDTAPAVTTHLPSALGSDLATLSVALSHALERRVARALAKRLLDRFGTLTAVLIADELSLAREAVRAPARRLLADMRRTLRGGLATALSAHQLRTDDPVLIEYLLLGQETRPAERLSCLYFDDRDRMVGEESWPTPTLALAEIGRPLRRRRIVSAVTVHTQARHDGRIAAADLACADALAGRLMSAGIRQRDHFLVVGATYWRARESRMR